MRYVFANCELDTQRSVMRRGTKQGKLGPKLIQVLCYLLEHADRVVSREELAEQCWSDRDCNEATILNTIRAVRWAVGDNTRNPGIIHSYPNLGYRVAVPVTVVSEESGVTAGERQPTETRTEPLEADDTTLDEDESTPRLSVPTRPHSLPPRASVRRQLTVLFCDLVVSPVRVTRVDLEDYVEVIRACHDACTAIITPFEGHIVPSSGDGFLVYFGYPQAHEDDAQRAVSSALGMLERIAQLNDRLSLNDGVQVTAQMGIHTGLAVTNGQSVQVQVEPRAFGEAPSIAVRLQESLAPNTIGISAATYHLVAGYFSCRALGSRAIRGLSEPIEVYQVLRRHHTQSRFGAAMLMRGLTPLVGRENEIAFLLAQWEQARSGVGSVVCIRGDAGVGKSRLVQALKEQIAFDTRMLLECQSSPYYQRTAFWPLTQWFEPLCHWEQFERPDMKVKKLETALTQFMLPREETLALFAELLALTSRDGEETLRHMSPFQRRRRIMDALLTILFALAEQGPIVLVMEDVQWADSSTLELLSLLVDQVAGARMLVLLTARSDCDLSLNAQLSMPGLRLGSLTDQQVEHLIIQLTNGKVLPAEVLQQLVAKADGVPLFVEEMTRMVLDSELVVERGDRYELRDGLQELAIPSTLPDQEFIQQWQERSINLDP